MPDELLELREPDGAYARVEEWLRERGFFAPGGEELVAELYLGYGLSQTIRRTRTPSRPSPVLRSRSPPAGSGPPSGAPVRRLRARGLGADVDGRRARARDRGGARRDRARRRLPGQPRAAPAAPFAGDPRVSRGASPRCDPFTPSPFVAGTLGRRLGLARALPLPPRRPDLDDADQGHEAARRRGRAACVREGRGRARHDRRPRAQRPLARVRRGHGALARAHGDPRARGRRAHGLDGRGHAARGRRSGGDPRRDVPRRIGDGRAEDRCGRSHRGSSSPSAAARRWARSA